MNRKQFVQSAGATCVNWRNSWSYINKVDKVIIFGAWDKNIRDDKVLILSSAWKIGSNGRKNSAYKQSLEHIRLIEEEGYSLKIFPLIHSAELQDEKGNGPSKIKSFERQFYDKILVKLADGWYAADDPMACKLAEEISSPEYFTEGGTRSVKVNVYERSPEARAKCIEHFGFICSVCGFDFEKVYGNIGKNFIHVHHIVPIHTIKRKYKLDPVRDLRPVCPNCHAMLHRKQPAMKIERLKEMISPSKSKIKKNYRT